VIISRVECVPQKERSTGVYIYVALSIPSLCKAIGTVPTVPIAMF